MSEMPGGIQTRSLPSLDARRRQRESVSDRLNADSVLSCEIEMKKVPAASDVTTRFFQVPAF